jgi:predicted NAD/FAD-binding protein
MLNPLDLADMGEGYPVKRVAVVGNGGSALGALWALGHSQHQVYLYEAQNRLGGSRERSLLQK